MSSARRRAKAEVRGANPRESANFVKIDSRWLMVDRGESLRRRPGISIHHPL